MPGPAVVTENGVWFGLAGGFSGGDGQFGGLVVYDRRDRTFHVLRHKYMVDAAVTRLLIVGDDVWMGTGRFGPVSIDGLRGVVLFRPNKREWRQFAPDNSRISGDLVFDLATDGRMLWATTNQGVSRYDRMRRLWTSWYWHPAKDGKGFELTRRAAHRRRRGVHQVVGAPLKPRGAAPRRSRRRRRPGRPGAARRLVKGVRELERHGLRVRLGAGVLSTRATSPATTIAAPSTWSRCGRTPR